MYMCIHKCICVFTKCICVFTKCICVFTKCICVFTKCICAFTKCICVFRKCICVFTKCICVFTKCVCVFTKCICIFSIDQSSTLLSNIERRESLPYSTIFCSASVTVQLLVCRSQAHNFNVHIGARLLKMSRSISFLIAITVRCQCLAQHVINSETDNNLTENIASKL